MLSKEVICQDEEDKQQVRKFQAGDKSAFDPIWNIHNQRVVRYVSMLLPRDDAEDVAQEVFARVARALPRYRITERPFHSWLYRIAGNEVVRFHLHRNRHRELDVISLEFLEPQRLSGDDMTNPEYQVLIGDEFKQAREIIQTLPADYQQVLVLRFVLEHSLLETSQIMGRSNGAIRVLQHRAVKKVNAVKEFNERKAS